MILVEYPDSDMMFIDLANKLADELEECLATHERATFAVPGGSTPGPVFDALSAVKLDWSRVTVVLTDERRVPVDHPRSNERLLRERLLVGEATQANYVSIQPQGGDLDGILEGCLPLSVVLLGMGEDMHTASLFPGSPQLDEALKSPSPLLYVDAPDGLEPRVTLSGPALAGSMNCHVLIKGAEKRAALERAALLSPNVAPIKTVLSHATIHWAP